MNESTNTQSVRSYVNQDHDLRGSHDVIAHLINQHSWSDYAYLKPDELLALHRELHELRRLDEQARELYETELKGKTTPEAADSDTSHKAGKQ